MNIKAICGEVTAKYEIIRILGQGQSGIVYLAKHKKLQVLRAIKTVPRKSRFYEFIKNEAELLKELRHPGIPIIYDFMEEEQDLYLIEEYVEGESLFEYIQRCGRFSVQSLAKFGLDLVEPLEYLHGKSIAHMDLSPNNILISDNKPRIIDFDHSAHLHDENKGYGSFGFASKEQICRERVDASMDIYAIGAILYYAAVCEKYEGDIHKIPMGMGEIREIIKKCLAANKNERYHSLSELKSELQKISVGKISKKIAVVGAKAGLGVTFLSICLAKEMKSRNKEICLFERNLSGDMSELAKRTKQKYINGFSYERIPVFPFIGPYIEAHRFEVEIEILDCKEDVDRAVSENPDVLILVCSAKLWNIKYNLDAVGRILSELKFRNTLLTVYNCCGKKDKIFLPSNVNADFVVRIPVLEDLENNRCIKDLASFILKQQEEKCGF